LAHPQHSASVRQQRSAGILSYSQSPGPEREEKEEGDEESEEGDEEERLDEDDEDDEEDEDDLLTGMTQVTS
jgi:ribosomal protein L12E/L44/L45/RPP1/RPP2